jgi:hypothetical protein
VHERRRLDLAAGAVVLDGHGSDDEDRIPHAVGVLADRLTQIRAVGSARVIAHGGRCGG